MNTNYIEINGIPSRLIRGIPSAPGPEKTPSALTASILKVVDVVPDEPPAAFEEDVWDFKDFMVYCNSGNNLIRFVNAPQEAKGALKRHAAWLLDGANRVPTVSKRIGILTTLLNTTIQQTAGGRYETVTAEALLSVIDAKDVQPSIKRLYTQYVQAYYAWLTDQGVTHIVNCGALRSAARNYAQQAKFHKTQHFPDIPQPLYMAIRNRMEALLYDEAAPLRDRMVAGMVLVTSQTGLRHSETPALKVNCREEIEMPDGTVRTVINYWRIKRSRKPGRPDLQKTICTELAGRAIGMMLEIRKRILPGEEGEYLAVLPGMDGSTPVSLDTYGDAYKAVLIRNVPECDLDWPGIKRIKEKTKRRNSRTFSVPALHSYRVHFISALYTAGVPIPYIEHLVSHAPGEVDAGYYGGVKKPHNELLDD